ncbi:conserved hypothetical protein [Hyphomicrobiales bacterium]|jgi:hypothetical protein|nr:conserved hypothetical protein [Hyphomicrobiales bacterium]CAH1702903.1 conserved hypothetical protein [Hyphomicrobiales bacterium]CAI0347090.1 conserved hypothetical protein [Hyphomicrobiales bacterium]
MPLFLIRERHIPGPMTVAAADQVIEVEVEATDVLAAATLVMFREPGPLAAGLVHRQHRDPYTGIAIEPDRARYGDFAEIHAGKPETLPMAHFGKARLGPDVVAGETLRLHNLIARHENGDVSLALQNVLGSMLDFARANNVNLQHVLDAISCDYETITGRAPPALGDLGFDRELLAPTEASTRAGAAAVAIHTQFADIVDEDDPEIGLFHLAFTLIEEAHRRNLDFPAIAEQMLVDRAAAPAPRI